MPARADLGAWLRRALDRGVRLEGASDHAVSEAIYLSDPEGNGIEVYADRPRAAWPRGPAPGEVDMITEPLDARGLMAVAAPGEGRAPAGTRVGHIHLRVGDTAAAERFYAGVLGLDVTHRRPGATFFSSGGYHHHVAGNAWGSRGAGRRTPGATGLESFELVATDRAAYDDAVARLRAAGLGRDAAGGGMAVEDPWGTTILLRPPSPATT